jgi:hypothetical protein
MNGAVDPTAAQERRVGGIHDSVYPQDGDIAPYNMNFSEQQMAPAMRE